MSGKLLALSPSLDFDHLDDLALKNSNQTSKNEKKQNKDSQDGKKEDESSSKCSNPTKASAYKKKNKQKTRRVLTCDLCDSPLDIYNGHYLCSECGICEDILHEEDAAFTNYNNDPGASSSLKIIGKEASKHQKHHIQMTSDYSKKKEIDSKAEFDKLYSKSNRAEKPPRSIYDKASELFNLIQSGQVNRSSRRKGIQVACICVEAKRAGMTKDRGLMAEIHNTSLKVLNKGIDDLEVLAAQGIIDIPKAGDDEDSFIAQNFRKYNIDMKFIPFVTDFVDRSNEKHVSPSSGPNPKCIGTIYLLAKLLKMNDVLDRLAKECEISRPTYLRFYNGAIAKHDKFQKVYQKYDHLGLKWKKARKLT
jgi:uncharacterized Zn finger protein (UPF0148 family)